MRVATRLAGGYLLLFLLFGALIIFYHRALLGAVASGRALSAVDSRVVLVSNAQLDRLAQVAEDGSKFRVTRDRRYFVAYRDGVAAFSDSLAVLNALPVNEQLVGPIRLLRGAWDSFVSGFASFRAEGDEVAFLIGAEPTAWNAHTAALAQVRQSLVSVRRAAQNSIADQIVAISTRSERVIRLGWIVTAVALLLAGGLAIWSVASITRPLARVEAAAGAVAQGQFDVRTGLDARNDEFGSLATSFDAMARRLNELDQMKRDFLASISHDLKTPLASIREAKLTLLDRLPGDLNERQERLLTLSLANVDRLSSMITKLLELARVNAGVSAYEFGPVELSELCTSVTSGMSPLAPAGLEVSTPAGEVWARADRAALERVLSNLVENAISHAPGGPIEVALTTDGDAGAEDATISVRDYGPGIPEEERHRVFERFYSSGAGSSPGHTGLGLAICREVVQAHGGKITVGDAPGGGSVFHFTLPLADPGSAAA